MNNLLNPAVTVAAVVPDNDRFLFVEERTSGGIAVNQPAGHLEPGETALEGLVRETLEETACHVEPQALVGVYFWRRPARGVTVVRFAFAARLRARDPEAQLDDDVLRTLWLTRRELDDGGHRLRSPLVTRCVDDFLAGRRYPLELLRTVAPEAFGARR